jgi:sulfur dioxygenase
MRPSFWVNGGGAAGPTDLWAALVAGRGELSSPLGSLLQLRSTEGSSTFTYILADAASMEAIILDPVVEHTERDIELVCQLGCTLTLAFNTHVHADHVSGSGQLKQAVGGLRSCISKASGAQADVKLSPGDVVTWGGGRRRLTVLATPGHTDGCLTYHDEAMGAVFTGDALLIGGCGRTDFQQGSAQTLYESIHTQLFTCELIRLTDRPHLPWSAIAP